MSKEANSLNELNKEDLVVQVEQLSAMVTKLQQNQKGLVDQNNQLHQALQGNSKLIYARLLDLKRDVSAVSKDGVNDFGGWNFRGIDQMLNYFKPLMDKHRIGVTVNTKMFSEPKFIDNGKGKNTKHCNLIMEYEFFTDDGSSIKNTVPAEAVATDDKGVAKALSQGLKYLLIQGFVTPTEDVEDPDKSSVAVGSAVDKTSSDSSGEISSKKEDKKPIPRKADVKKTPARASSSFRKDKVNATSEASDEL